MVSFSLSCTVVIDLESSASILSIVIIEECRKFSMHDGESSGVLDEHGSGSDRCPGLAAAEQ